MNASPGTHDLSFGRGAGSLPIVGGRCTLHPNMNERLVAGCERAAANDRDWVFAAAALAAGRRSFSARPAPPPNIRWRIVQTVAGGLNLGHANHELLRMRCWPRFRCIGNGSYREPPWPYRSWHSALSNLRGSCHPQAGDDLEPTLNAGGEAKPEANTAGPSRRLHGCGKARNDPSPYPTGNVDLSGGQ